MRALLIGMASALALSGCSPSPSGPATAPSPGLAQSEAFGGAMPSAGMDAAAPSVAPVPSAEGGPPDAQLKIGAVVENGPVGPPVAGAMLAYAYTAGLWLPLDKVRPVMAAHEKACVDAGPAVCQVIGASTSQANPDDISGLLELRAEPRFAQTLAARLEGDATGAKGRIEQSRTSEDLTRAITDTEATLRAKTTLRDRLQGLLRNRPGKLSDLLETEQALANVQQEIDSAQSYLAQMRQRVTTSRLSIAYQTLRGPVAGADFNPVSDAINGFLGNMAIAFATVLTLVAYGLPWLVVGLPVAFGGWTFAKWLLSRRRKSATSTTD